MKRIALHSVPRSGSTWLGSILDSSPKVIYRFQPLFSYGHKGNLTTNSTSENIDKFFKDIKNTEDKFVLQTIEKEKKLRPSFQKQETDIIVYKEVRYHHILRNLLKRDKKIKVIGLVRNPLSVINSWLRAPKEFKKELGWKELEEWRWAPKKNLNIPEEFNGYEKWKEVALLFEELKEMYPERFYLMNYKDLLRNTKEEVIKSFNFCDIKLTEQTLNFIDTSSNTDQSREAYSVYRKNHSDEQWKVQLNPLIIDEIKNDLVGTKLEKYLR